VPGEQAARVELVTRADCHLCDVAKAGLQERGIAFTERDVDADPALFDAYTDTVPVVLVDGKQVSWGRVDLDRVEKAARSPKGRWKPW
jgi:glutaredoxin